MRPVRLQAEYNCLCVCQLMPVAIRKAIVQSVEQKTNRGEKKRNREGEGRETEREREGCGLIQAWNIIRLETTARTKGREPVKSVIKQAKAKVTSQLSERRDRYIRV